jgi:hypothetical protein
VQECAECNDILRGDQSGHAMGRVFNGTLFSLFAEYGGNLVVAEVVGHIEYFRGCLITLSSK